MKKTIWALFDDRVGSVNQAKGIIQALGDEYDVTYKHITYNRWASLPNCLLGASTAGISKDCPVDLSQPYPDIILSVSRRTTPIARYLKRKSQGKSKIVQLMYPGNCGIKELDLIIASQHDAAKCKNGNIFLISASHYPKRAGAYSRKMERGLYRPAGTPHSRHYRGRHQGQAVQRRKRPQSGTGC